jgi:hypothetical protein
MKKSRSMMIIMSVLLVIITLTMLAIFVADLYNGLSGTLWCANGMKGVQSMPDYECGSWPYYIMVGVDALALLAYAWTTGYLIFFLYKYWSTDIVSIKETIPIISSTIATGNDQSIIVEQHYQQDPYYSSNSISIPPPVRNEI